jgi:hypothetical protein
LGQACHWRECYDDSGQVSGRRSRRKAAKSVASIVFFSFQAGGQKGLHRSSRKRMNLFGWNLGFCWFAQYTF